jgi:hypothetical protein
VNRRDLLQLVADGRLSPTEAAALLASASDQEQEPSVSADGAPVAAPPSGPRLTKVRVEGGLRRCKIVGDPSVAEVRVEGQHTIDRRGECIVINADDALGAGWSFASARGASLRLGRDHRASSLSIRMNPTLALELAMDASTTSVDGVTGPIVAKVDAGSLAIKGSAAPVDLRVDAGVVAFDGRLADGNSRIRCDVGDVKILLRQGSDVRVTSNVDVGRISVGNSVDKGIRIGGSSRELVVGDGTATLDIQTGIGRVKVETE